MSVQSSVRQFQTTGLAGEFAKDGPRRARPFNLLTGGGGTPNIIGRVYTQPSDGNAALGDGTDPVLGVLVHPKEHALVGDGASALAAVNALPDGAVGQIADMGILYADLAGAVTLGDVLTFNTTTGIISNTAADATNRLFGATAYADLSGAGLGIIQLTN